MIEELKTEIADNFMTSDQMTGSCHLMILNLGDIQEALENYDSWMKDVSSALQLTQEKEEDITEDVMNLNDEMNTKLNTQADDVAWKEADDDFDASIKTVRDTVSSSQPSADARRRKVDEILATIHRDIAAVETDPEESKAADVPNGRIDSTDTDTTATRRASVRLRAR